MSDIAIKLPQSDYELHPLIQKRWSPFGFSDKMIELETLQELFEAARWSASTANEQPWKYAYAFRGTTGFKELLNCLSQKHHGWAGSAAVIIVAMKRNTFRKNGKLNDWAAHDLGMANAQLLLQAVHRNIYGHLIAGFSKDKVSNVLSLDKDTEPICMGALGYLGTPVKLDADRKARDLGVRKRIAMQSFVKEIK